MNVTHLECAACSHRHEARRLLNLCTQCGKPLLVRYDLKAAAVSLTKDSLKSRGPDLWRYRELLPVDDDENIVSLGEGFTPLLQVTRLGAAWLQSALHQGRRPESDAEFQSAGHGGGGFDGQRAGRDQARRAVGG